MNTYHTLRRMMDTRDKMDKNGNNVRRSMRRGEKIQFSVLVDTATFDRIETARGYVPRAIYIAEMIRKTLSGEKKAVR